MATSEKGKEKAPVIVVPTSVVVAEKPQAQEPEVLDEVPEIVEGVEEGLPAVQIPSPAPVVPTHRVQATVPTVVAAQNKKDNRFTVQFIKDHEFNVAGVAHTCKKGDKMKVEIQIANKLVERSIAYIIS